MAGTVRWRAASPSPIPPPSKPGTPSSSASTHQRPLEKLLDRRLHSVSSFLSVVDSVDFGSPSSRPEASQWSQEMPEVILFPPNKPSSRADAAILNRWVSVAFANYAQRVAGWSPEASDDEVARAVEELVPVLSIGLHEIVRQVRQHCTERALVLEKIWRTYVELFERALSETRAALRRHREKTARVEAELEQIQLEVHELQKKHPEQLERLSSTLSGKFTQRQSELAEQIQTKKGESKALNNHFQEQENSFHAFFPMFNKYKDSSLKRPVQVQPPVTPAATTAEGKLTADFKRVLLAMSTEQRRRVSFFIGTLLGLKSSQISAATRGALLDRKEHNRKRIERLEAQLWSFHEKGVVIPEHLLKEISQRMLERQDAEDLGEGERSGDD